jgi:hypothetical protein
MGLFDRVTIKPELFGKFAATIGLPSIPLEWQTYIDREMNYFVIDDHGQLYNVNNDKSLSFSYFPNCDKDGLPNERCIDFYTDHEGLAWHMTATVIMGMVNDFVITIDDSDMDRENKTIGPLHITRSYVNGKAQSTINADPSPSIFKVPDKDQFYAFITLPSGHQREIRLPNWTEEETIEAFCTWFHLEPVDIDAIDRRSSAEIDEAVDNMIHAIIDASCVKKFPKLTAKE